MTEEQYYKRITELRDGSEFQRALADIWERVRILANELPATNAKGGDMVPPTHWSERDIS